MKEKVKVVLGCIVIAALLILIGVLIYRGVCHETEEVEHPVVSFKVGDETVSIELYPEYAPNTVANFIALAEAGYYDDKLIYGRDNICLYMGRTEEDEEEDEESEEETTDSSEEDEDTMSVPMVSYIDDSVETGSDDDYEYEINGEFIVNGFDQNTLRHEKGVISLNRYDYSYYGLTEEGYNSGSAQFSIMMKDEPNLNGMYCAFGKVIEGLDVLEEIYNNSEVVVEEETTDDTETEETANEETTDESTDDSEEEEDNTIKEFTSKKVMTDTQVDTKGVTYDKPEVHEAFDIQGYINQLYSSYYSN